MGYPMAVNLRSKLSADYALLICDVNHDAVHRFQTQMIDTGPVRIVSNGFEAVQQAVSLAFAYWVGIKRSLSIGRRIMN